MGKPRKKDQDSTSKDESCNKQNGVKQSKNDRNDESESDHQNNFGLLENIGRKLDAIPEINSAERALIKAKQEFEKAIQRCKEFQFESKKTAKEIGEQSISQVIDESIDFVRKHPLQGLLFAGILGVLIGKWFRE